MGETDGAGVGALEGPGEGETVGPGVGVVEGAGEGENEGAGVGELEGAGVGDTDGPGVGELEGADVGDTDGPGVGATVGPGVGETVGARDGLGVGETVGDAVGAGVYDTWKSMESPRHSAPSSHVSVSVYALTTALPVTVCSAWPSLASTSETVSVTTAVTLRHDSGSPRYSQNKSQGTSETQKLSTPMLMISRWHRVGAAVGVAVGAGVGEHVASRSIESPAHVPSAHSSSSV